MAFQVIVVCVRMTVAFKSHLKKKWDIAIFECLLVQIITKVLKKFLLLLFCSKYNESKNYHAMLMYWLFKLWHWLSQNEKYVTYATLILIHTFIDILMFMIYAIKSRFNYLRIWKVPIYNNYQQFFGVADAMELLKDKHPDLSHCEGSIKFCRRVESLITVMNCRTPMNSLKPGNDMWKVLKNYVYL